MGLFRWLFAKACRAVFNRVDVDKSGSLDSLEIEIAILQLYNVFNKKLPGWQDPPNRESIQASLKAFDTDGNGRLDTKEFEEFARQLMANGPDMFFARMGKQAMFNTALLPGAAVAVQRSAAGMGLTQVAALPLAVLAPILGTIFAGIRGLIPV